MADDSILEFLKSCETKVIKLESGEPLAIVIKSDEIDTGMLDTIRLKFRESLPYLDNQVLICVLPLENDIDFITLKEAMEKANGIS